MTSFWDGAADAATSQPTLVFIPGSGSSGDRIHIANLNWGTKLLGGDRYFGAFLDKLKERGVPALVCPRTPDDDRRTIEERVDDCVATLLERRGGTCARGEARDIALVGHSMGGLVARELAQDPRIRNCIHSVTTISTPNRGTPISDYAIERSRKDDRGFDWFGRMVKLIHFEPKYLHYLPQLRVDRAAEPTPNFHAQDLPDNPEVTYYSITNSMEAIPIPTLEFSRAIIAAEVLRRELGGTAYGTANDGIVPEYSMPHGKVIGRLDVHHWASACVDPVKTTDACRTALNFLLPHFEMLYRGLQRQEP